MSCNGIYKIAGCVFEIRSVYPSVHELCRDYVCSEDAEALIEIKASDIIAERERSAKEDAFEGRQTLDYPEYYLEELAVYRKICEYAVGRDSFLFHGSALAFDGRGCIFTAKSGTGKSTHAALWRKVFGDRVVTVNDDKPIVSLRDGEPVVYGTPWNGKHGLGSNISVPLHAICFLERGEQNTVEELRTETSRSEIFYRLLGQTFRPGSAAALKKTLDLLGVLCGRVRFYRLKCNMCDDAALICADKIFGLK